jgi:proteasome accessory factor C
LPPSESRPAGSKTPKASERLRRLLVMVPYLVRHPGTQLTEAARLFGVTEGELTDDLDLLFVSGLPPYGPGDLIDVDIEDGRVWIRMADYFERPLRLTRNEALALYLRGVQLAGAPGLHEADALRSALEKLRDGLGPETLGEVAGRVEAEGGGRAVEAVEELRRSAADRERIEIEYYAGSTAQTSVRRIDPEHVFYAIGHWYVAAWDHHSGEERLFRADRIKRATRTGERFEPRGLAGAGRPLYTPTERDTVVRLRLGRGARWVAEYYEVGSAREGADGSLEIEFPTGRLEWVARLILRLGGEARILAPVELKDRVRELARLTGKQYQQGSPVRGREA